MAKNGDADAMTRLLGGEGSTEEGWFLLVQLSRSALTRRFTTCGRVYARARPCRAEDRTDTTRLALVRATQSLEQTLLRFGLLPLRLQRDDANAPVGWCTRGQPRTRVREKKNTNYTTNASRVLADPPQVLGPRVPPHELGPVHDEAVRHVVQHPPRERERLHAAPRLDEDDTRTRQPC